MQTAAVSEQYKQFPELRKEDVEKLMTWIRQQQYLPKLTELEVIAFLHSCYNSMELAKRTIDFNFTMRTHCPELFHNLDVNRPELKIAMNVLTMCELPQRTPEGYRVIIFGLANTDSSIFNFQDIIKSIFVILDYIILENGVSNGEILVIDVNGVSLGHLAKFALMTMKKFFQFLQEAEPIRVKGFHFINPVSFMDKILALVYPFLKKELQDALKLHNKIEDIYSIVPKEMLPSDYGGDEKSVNLLKDELYEKIHMDRENIIAKERRYKVDEKLRPGKPKTASDLFGVAGNFRKLDFD